MWSHSQNVDSVGDVTVRTVFVVGRVWCVVVVARMDVIRATVDRAEWSVVV